jgi:hypothetical protein
MQRLLVFEGEKAQEKFDKVWEGFVFGSKAAQARRQPTGQPPNKEEQRRSADILRKLKAVSTEGSRIIVGGVKYRELGSVAQAVRLTQPEHESLVKILNETEWNPEVLDEVFDVIDWVDAAEKEEK